MAGSFGGCHEDIDSLGGDNLLVPDVEAVSKSNRLPFREVRQHLGLVHIRLLLVIDEYHDDVSGLRCF